MQTVASLLTATCIYKMVKRLHRYLTQSKTLQVISFLDQKQNFGKTCTEKNFITMYLNINGEERWIGAKHCPLQAPEYIIHF